MSKEDAKAKYVSRALELFGDVGSSGGSAAASKDEEYTQWPAFAAHTAPMLPAGTFEGQVAFITGGGTGLGKAMATTLSKLGAKVVIASRKLPVLESAAAEISAESGGEVLPVACDVRDVSAIKAALDACEAKFGLPTVVINNAAGNFISPTERLSSNAFGNVVDIVLKGTASVTLEAGKRLIAAKQSATFLSISTTYADLGSGYVTPSAAAKAGVSNMVRSLGSEWGKYGLRFVGIAPGPIETEGAFSRLDPTGQFRRMMIARLPSKRLGETGELANFASYLVSPYAGWITGQVFTFDGGESTFMSGEFNELERVTEAQWDSIEAIIRGGNKK